MSFPLEHHQSTGIVHSTGAAAVRLPSGRTLDLRRSRWQGPLDAEELAWCRQHAIELAYDCAQLGWVPSSCTDDAQATAGGRAVDAAPAASPEQDARRLLAKWNERTDVRELAPLVAAFHARHGVRAANQFHLALMAAFAHGPLSKAGDGEFSFRPWTPADAPLYRAMLDNPRLWEYLPESYPQPLTDETARTLIELGQIGAHQEALAVLHDGEPVGQCLLRFHEPFAGRRAAEVAYWLAEEHWGKGWMSRILPTFLARSFAAHDVDVIEAWIRADHSASARVAERCGFRRDAFAFEAELAAALGKSRARRWLFCRPALPRAQGAAVVDQAAARS
ncbi:MAG: GNAT family N-acetyltransferase [Planctomycetes bacterium]|nr:GNAT family N-acetyltransferase [Planctomycetota bacterium]